MENPGPVISLNFGDNQIILNVVKDNDSDRFKTLGVGLMQDILSRLQHEPATAYELEVTIADIEDSLMPIISKLPERRYLATSEPAISQIAMIAGFGTDEPVDLTMETVELLYNCLVDMAYGTPSARLGVPETREFAAAVLFLRELMHHAGFDVVHIRP